MTPRGLRERIVELRALIKKVNGGLKEFSSGCHAMSFAKPFQEFAAERPGRDDSDIDCPCREAFLQ
jgi:hypothetical protein